MHPMMSLGYFCVHRERCQVSCFTRTNPHFLIIFFSVFSWVGQHCFGSWWHSHITDVIIVNPTQANLVSWPTFSHGVVTSLVVQVKEKLYCDYYPMDVFSLLPYLVLWPAFSHGVVTSLVVQVKEKLYCDYYPMDIFSLLP
jgi:hypothetical protein